MRIASSDIWGNVSNKRYYVIESTGYSMDTEPRSGRLNTSYSIIDRHWGHREIRCYYAEGGQGRREQRERLARAECRRLNREERAWEQAG